MTDRMIRYAKGDTCAVAVKALHKRRVYNTTINYKPKSTITCTFPRLQHEVPIMNILLALGITVDEIRGAFDPAELALLEASFKNLPSDKDEAMRRIPLREVYTLEASATERVLDAFKYVMLPHVDSFTEKAIYIICMIKELLSVALGLVSPTDRDSAINQRCETACDLMSTLFHHTILKICTDVRTLSQRTIAKRKTAIPDSKIRDWFSKTTTITDSFQYSLGTGNWNTQNVNRQSRVGVSQQLQRLTLMATISQLRRVSSTLESSQKMARPRWLQGTHYGHYCNYETPEGQPCGLETQLTIQALVSLESDPDVVRNVIKHLLKPMTLSNLTSSTSRVFLNGRYIGNTSKASELLTVVRRLRRSGQCSKDVSVSVNDRSIVHISTTTGRLCRPLLIVTRGRLKYKESHAHKSFAELLTSGIVEYIDCEEQDTMLIAFKPEDITLEHTHCEISATLMNGVCAASIPFSNHNPSARNCYQSAMGKQAVSMPMENYQTRFDTTQNILQYPQKPLASTNLADKTGIHACPSGINVVVAIMPFSGFGQEDSVIVNQSAIDRGFARADKYKTTVSSLSTNGEVAYFGKPTKKRKHGKYDQLDDDGIVNRFSKVTTKDCVIGKQIEKSSDGMVTQVQDASIMSDSTGVVEDIILFEQRNGEKAVAVKTRCSKVPEVGDKYSSRHGQKGTQGISFTQEDLPWTQDGLVPDLIVNPHAIPSRMTIAHLIEMISGIGACHSGNFIDASPFGGATVEQFQEELKKYGLSKSGKQRFYCPKTGHPIQAMLYTGVIYYQRLKHMVSEKLHARGRGRRNELTNQPIGGRGQGGGLRIGEMEKDAFNSHGVPFVINERMMVSSDAKKVKVCRRCRSKTNLNQSTCKACGQEAIEITMPSAADLLFDELRSMMVNVQLVV